ncbi:hypothetical protein [Pseudomonas sp. NPDC089401]|uniref:hypothetical protein n=1 Tax=Pseudomonas sp. NPDC089401 TaxID=3364462 RepID=UPI00382DB231
MSLPVTYHLEVYQDSFLNDPIWSVKASTPFPALSKGDSFDHRALNEATWSYFPEKGQEFVIAKIRHIFWDLKSELGHKLMVILKAVDIQN